MVSLRDRVLSASGTRVAIIVSPDIDLLSRGVNLALLRRWADREQIDMGLVTVNRDLRRHARAVGVAAFDSTGAAERSRGGWRQLTRREKLGFAPGDDWQSPRTVAKP